MMTRTALITGASRLHGIGAAIARALAHAGLNIAITTYTPYDQEMPWTSRPDESDDLIASLRALDVTARRLEIDLRQPEAAEQVFDYFGPIEVLINNAAYSVNDGIDQLTAAHIDAHYAVNVRGMMLLCAEFARRWHHTHGGRIINLTSGQGFGPMPDELAYAATKGAVDAFTVSLSAALMPRGITVNAIDPGITDSGWITDDLRSHLIEKAPTGRIGQPDDAARLIAFLVSEEARWVTGQILRSRGGQ